MFILLTLAVKGEEGKGDFNMIVPVDSIEYFIADDDGDRVGLRLNGVAHEYHLRTNWHAVADRLMACGRFVKA